MAIAPIHLGLPCCSTCRCWRTPCCLPSMANDTRTSGWLAGDRTSATTHCLRSHGAAHACSSLYPLGRPLLLSVGRHPHRYAVAPSLVGGGNDTSVGDWRGPARATTLLRP